jgi:hypothetical protein
MAAGTAATAATFAVALKERMMDMPDELNTKKEIDEYFKNLMKELKDEMKKEKIENAEKKKNDKKKKKDNLDEDGNEKPKKPLNKYQQFIKDNQDRIKEEFPELSNTERFTKLAEEWNKFKATLVDKEDKEDKEVPSDEDKEEEKEEKELPKEDEEKEKKPKKAKKTTKKAE